MEKIKLNSCFQIAKKIPTSQCEKTIENVSKLIYKNYESYAEFIQKSEKPFPTCRDDSLGEFIKSEYNNEGDSFRSPWSNKYFPDIELPKFPPSELRELEIIFNRIFKEYARLYYGEMAVSSVYVWEQGESIENGFSVALLVKNQATNFQGEWDAINVVNVKFYKEKEKNVERIKTFYKLNSTVIFKLAVEKLGAELSGTLSKQIEESHYIKSYLEHDFHVEKIGKMVETCENNLKNQIDEIYMKKTIEVNLFNLIILDYE